MARAVRAHSKPSRRTMKPKRRDCSGVTVCFSLKVHTIDSASHAGSFWRPHPPLRRVSARVLVTLVIGPKHRTIANHLRLAIRCDTIVSKQWTTAEKP